MRVSFNVLNDPWIPVVALNGSREILGIRETLQRAPELKEISAVSPLEEYSIYRFLSVFLMDALRPEDLDTIEELLEEETFDMEQIEAYTAADENPWPRFSWDLLVPPCSALLALIWLIRFLRRHRKRRPKAPDIKPIKKRYVR